MPWASKADTRVFFGSAEFEVEVTSRGASLTGLERLTASAEIVAQASEVSSVPAANTGLGNTLTFLASNTGFSRDYTLKTLQAGATFTFDDDEEAGNIANFDNALSVGDIDNAQDDDWSLSSSGPLRAVGFHLYDNVFSAGEALTLHDEVGTQLERIPLEQGNEVSQFVGVITDYDFYEIRFDEGPGGDDIAIANFKFPRPFRDSRHSNFYGNQLAITPSGKTLAAAAMGLDSAGMVFVHDRNLGGTENWGIIAKLTAPDGADNDRFGHSLDISADGNTVAVGAPFHNTNGVADAGAVYVFRRNQGGENNWGFYKKLIATAGVFSEPPAVNDRFGFDLALDDAADRLAVGVPGDDGTNANGGSVYVFRRNTGGADNYGVSSVIYRSREPSDACGQSVAISGNGDVLALGCPLADNEENAGETDFGRVEFVSFSGTEPVSLEKFIVNRQFGSDVALDFDGTTVAIAQVGGSTLVFTRSSPSAIGLTQLPRAFEGGDGADLELSPDGDQLLVGAPRVDFLAESNGIAVLYTSGSSLLSQSQPIRSTSSIGYAGNNYGHGVAMTADGSEIVVGAPSIDAVDINPNPQSGNVSFFKSPNLAGDDVVTTFLVNGVIIPNTSSCFPIVTANRKAAVICL